jgi:hypothetical protein
MGPSGRRYTITGTGTGGGILKLPMPGEPSSWLAYVEVEDTLDPWAQDGFASAALVS